MLDELLLELADLGIGALPFLFGREALDPFDQDAAVPAAVEDREPPGARQVTPESPEVVLGALFVGRRGDRNDLVRAGVERCR